MATMGVFGERSGQKNLGNPLSEHLNRLTEVMIAVSKLVNLRFGATASRRYDTMTRNWAATFSKSRSAIC